MLFVVMAALRIGDGSCWCCRLRPPGTLSCAAIWATRAAGVSAGRSATAALFSALTARRVCGWLTLSSAKAVSALCAAARAASTCS
jgi:hypothetical protein